MKTAEDILALIAADSSRLHLLRVLREVGPEGAWIGAGFVRNAVWDHLHGYGEATPLADIDVLHFAREPSTRRPTPTSRPRCAVAARRPGR